MSQVSMNVGVNPEPRSSLLPRSNEKIGQNYQNPELAKNPEPRSSLLPRSNEKIGQNYYYQLFSECQKWIKSLQQLGKHVIKNQLNLGFA